MRALLSLVWVGAAAVEVLEPLVGSSRPVDAKFGSIWSLRSPSSGPTYATI